MSDQSRHDLAPLRNVCNDVWLDTLQWIERAEVGTKFALVNFRFNKMVDVHFNLRKWSLGEMCIQRAKGGEGAAVSRMNDAVHADALPMPITRPPVGVKGFKSLYICYVDPTVVTFLQDLRRHFNADITLSFSIEPSELLAWTIMAQDLWPLFRTGITTLTDMKRVDFVLLRRHISSSVLLDCANLRKIYTHMYPKKRTATTNNAIAAAASGRHHRHFDTEEHLFIWLHTPRNNDDLPKILRFDKWRRRYWIPFVDDLKMHFALSRTVVNFIISAKAVQNQTFDRQNDSTGETLSMMAPRGPEAWRFLLYDTVLMRFPSGLDRNHLAVKWLKQTTERPTKVVTIRLRNDDIAPSMFAEPSINSSG